MMFVCERVSEKLSEKECVCVPCTSTYENLLKMQRATQLQKQKLWIKFRMTIFYLNNALHFEVRIFVRILVL